MADISPTTTTSTFAASEVPNARAKVWKETFKKFASTADVLSPLEGPEGSGASIAVRNDIKGRRGDRIEFTASSELGAFGQLGESTLKGNEEDLKFSGTTAILEFKRHATALTSSLKKKMAGGHTLESLAAEVLGNHFGQWKQRDALRKIIDGVLGIGATAVAETASLPSGGVFGGGEDKLSDLEAAADAFTADSIVDLTTQAAWLGVEPARISRHGYQSSQDTYHHCLLADNQMLRPLLKTSGYQTQISNADLRGATNPLFTGDLKEFDGTKILNIRGTYGDLNGPIGSPLTPVARLKAIDKSVGSPTTLVGKYLCGAQSTRVTETGVAGATADPDYFADFRGHQYSYTEADTFASDANTYHVKIVNPNGTFAIVNYLGAVVAGDTGTGNHGTHIKVAAVVSNALTGGDASGDVVAGALCFPCNATGVIYGYTVLMGSDAVIRAYGEDMRMTDDKDDYGFKHGIGYQAMYGDSVWKDRNDRVRNYVLGVYAYSPIGIA
jgi:hypothetical protein